MKKIFILLIVFSVLLNSGCVKKESLQNSISNNNSEIYDIKMKQDLLCLFMGYPEYVKGITKENEKIYLIMKSGKKIIYDDKIKKSNEGKINNPDLQDMLEVIYPISEINNLMDKNYDPGRTRVYSLLKEVYGGYKGNIEKNLVNVRVGNKNFSFNNNNKAAESLKAAMEEINNAMKYNKNIYSFTFPSSGTYNYRVISGTSRLSPHSFGIAIDLKRDNNDYWKWTSRKNGEERLKKYPKELVKIFEKHNFIWGGKWGHFDILHFEYRPEFIIKAKYFSSEPDINKHWYYGVKVDDNVNKYIKLIENALN